MPAGPPAFRPTVESGGPFFCARKETAHDVQVQALGSPRLDERQRSFGGREDRPMTVKYKLSVRLALLKDALLLVPVAGILACDKPVGIAGPVPGPVVSRVALAPAQITLHPNQASQFTAVGLIATGDTVAVAVTWTATGGTIVDTSSRGSMHYATYQPSAVPGNCLVIP